MSEHNNTIAFFTAALQALAKATPKIIVLILSISIIGIGVMAFVDYNYKYFTISESKNKVEILNGIKSLNNDTRIDSMVYDKSENIIADLFNDVSLLDINENIKHKSEVIKDDKLIYDLIAALLLPIGILIFIIFTSKTSGSLFLGIALVSILGFIFGYFLPIIKQEWVNMIIIVLFEVMLLVLVTKIKSNK